MPAAGAPEDVENPLSETLLGAGDDKAFASLLDSELAKVNQFYGSKVSVHTYSSCTE